MRRIAREHNVDITKIQGTGINGRVTKQDILGFIESGGTERRQPPLAGAAQARCAGARSGAGSRLSSQARACRSCR